MEPINKDFEPTTLNQFEGFQKGASNYLMKRRPGIEQMKKLYYDYAEDPGFSAITITINSKYDSVTELKIRRIVQTALSCCEVSNYILYPDIGHSGNFHYHGIFKHPLRLRHKLKRFMTLMVGYIKIQYLSDIDGYYKYMRKDKGFRSKKHPVPLTEAIYDDKTIELFALTK